MSLNCHFECVLLCWIQHSLGLIDETRNQCGPLRMQQKYWHMKVNVDRPINHQNTTFCLNRFLQKNAEHANQMSNLKHTNITLPLLSQRNKTVDLICTIARRNKQRIAKENWKKIWKLPQKIVKPFTTDYWLQKFKTTELRSYLP